MSRRVQIVDDLGAVSQAALEKLQVCLGQTADPFRLSLAGGGTPKELYQLMAGTDLPWERIHLYWGDERFVPHDHPDSNYRMVREALLQHVGIPEAQLHPWPYLETPQASAEAYDRVLEDVDFDLVLLGMGGDGHTASLFPGTRALEVGDRRAVANRVDKMDAWRLTTTYPVINRARQVIFLIAGASKAEALEQVLSGSELPSSRVDCAGETLFLVDREAAARLPRQN